MNKEMTILKESISLNHEKSKKLFTINDEINRMKAIGKKIIKYSHIDLPSRQKDEAVQHTKFMLREVNSVAKQARKLHLSDATPELVQYLDEVAEDVKKARMELEENSKIII